MAETIKYDLEREEDAHQNMALVGGAQAVAALAYGTETVPAVDKIVVWSAWDVCMKI